MSESSKIFGAISKRRKNLRTGTFEDFANLLESTESKKHIATVISSIDNLSQTLPTLTKTQIRPIKKTEKNILFRNMMIIDSNIADLAKELNIDFKLRDLIKANGILNTTADNIDKHYDVLTLDHDETNILGQLIWFHDKTKNEIIIPAIEIHPECRGKNYGVVLFEYLFNFALQHQIASLSLTTATFNKSQKNREELKIAMLSFYIKLGFTLKDVQIENWYELSKAEKIELFGDENKKCILDLDDPTALSLFEEEVLKTKIIYQLEKKLLALIHFHAEKFIDFFHLKLEKNQLVSYLINNEEYINALIPIINTLSDSKQIDIDGKITLELAIQMLQSKSTPIEESTEMENAISKIIEFFDKDKFKNRTTSADVPQPIHSDDTLILKNQPKEVRFMLGGKAFKTFLVASEDASKKRPREEEKQTPSKRIKIIPPKNPNG